MKNKILFSILLLLTALVVPILADARMDLTVAYFDEATRINQIMGVDVILYPCHDASCSTLYESEKLVSNTGASSNAYLFSLPNDKPDGVTGYIVYAFKEGYLPMQYFFTYNDIVGKPRQENDFLAKIYLEKAKNAHAIIDTFNVVNADDLKANMPLIINVPAKLDAVTHSAFVKNSAASSYIPPGYERFYAADTQITLTIEDEAGTVVKSDNLVREIPMDDQVNIQFTWTPTKEGKYHIIVESLVIDNQVASSDKDSSQKWITVLEEEPRNACYVIVNKLDPSDAYPVVGETITFYVNQLANHADNSGDLTPVDKELTINIYKDDVLVKTDTISLAENADTVQTPTYSYQWTPTEIGNYGIEVTGVATDIICMGLTNIPDKISMNIRVATNPNAGTDLKFPAANNPNAVYEGDILTYDATARYNGRLPLVYSVQGLPGATIDSSGHLTWIVGFDTISHEETIVNYLKGLFGIPLSNEFKGTLTVREQNGLLNDVKPITVKVYDTNRPPVIQAPPEISITANGQFDINDYILAADPDHFDTLTKEYSSPLDSNGIIKDTSLLSGEYRVTITVKDNFGGVAVAVLTLKIANPLAPVAVITYSQDPTDPSIFRFDAQASYSPINKRLISYEWDFGDGTTDEGRSVTANYPGEKGSYYVTLKITDEDGRVGSAVILISFGPGQVIPKEAYDLHRFAIQNIVVKENKNDLNVFINVKNLGNQKENVMLVTTIENTNIHATMPKILDSEEGTWQLVKLAKPSDNSQYVIRVAAKSDDYDTLTYRVIKTEPKGLNRLNHY